MPSCPVVSVSPTFIISLILSLKQDLSHRFLAAIRTKSNTFEDLNADMMDIISSNRTSQYRDYIYENNLLYLTITQNILPYKHQNNKNIERERERSRENQKERLQ